MLSGSSHRFNLLLFAVILLLSPGYSAAQAPGSAAEFNGLWVIDEKASDDTDRQVEKAFKAAGGQIPRTGKYGKGRYRGGPPEQALYDCISYDDVLRISYQEPEFTFTYPQDFKRVFYSDGRSRSASARGDEGLDYSFAGWEGDTLRVESRPRDGGWIVEYYSLEAGGERMRAELQLKPSSFSMPVEIVRIFNRHQQQKPDAAK